MRPVLYVLTFLGLIALGFWAYRENYATQATLKEVRALQNDIASLREALSVQRAEWAYLNRPSRLRDLAALNFDSLGLLPMEPGQFSRVNQVAFPMPPLAFPGLGEPIDTIGALDGQTGSDGDGAVENPDKPSNGSEEPL